MRHRSACASLLALLLLAPRAALADPPRWTLHTGVDAWETGIAGFALDAEDTATDDTLTGRARLRTRVEGPLVGRKLRLVGELDFFARALHGAPAALGPVQADPAIRARDPFHPAPLHLRALYLEWAGALGVARLGTQPSDWGLGLVANDGARDDRLFGVPTRGNVSQRLMLATSPLQAIGAPPQSPLGRLTLLAAGDLVWADETAELLDAGGRPEDTAWQAVGALFVRPRTYTGPVARLREDVSGGVYAARRWQTYAEGDRLEVWVVDAHARVQQSLPSGASFRYEFEAARLFGETDRVTSEGGPNGLKINALGAVAEMAWGFPLGTARGEVMATIGLTSGDANADDDELNRFTMHGDYDVGFVLFDHVLPALQLRASERIDDPLRARTPPKGFEHLAGRGGVSGARYGALRFTAQPCATVDAAAQAVVVTTSAPFTDPVRTFERGGVPANSFGGPAEGTLATELDLAVRWRLPEVAPETRPAIRLTGGVVLPGAVLEGPDGGLGTVYAGQLAVTLDSHLGGGL